MKSIAIARLILAGTYLLTVIMIVIEMRLMIVFAALDDERTRDTVI